MMTLLLGLWSTCAAWAAPPADPRMEAWQATALDHRPDLLAELSVPDSSRALPLGEPVVVPGPWRLVATVDGVRTWETALPVRPRTLFFHRPPQGMELRRRHGDESWAQAETWKHRRGLDDADRAGTWEFSTHALRVRRLADAGPPAPGEYAISWDKAVEREQGLQRADFDGDDQDFVFRSAQLDDTTRHGLLLPAPATARFRVDVPPGGVLDLEPGILPPEAAHPDRVSDGARLVVRIDGQRHWSEDLAVGRFATHRLDLSAWAGRTVDLELVVEPGESSQLDYVFVADPVVHQPMASPPRVVVLFVDTLRQDELSLYGYDRPTTPKLDAFAADAAVFEDARSVAPWTLPSSRALLLGTQPERWDSSQALQERAAAAGWATAFISGNVYLSSNFGMDRGWGTHRCINWPTADVQVDRALDWLEHHPDRPSLLVLHLMDMHLPYTEPASYRHLFAGELPEALGSERFQRSSVTKARSKLGEEGKQYVRDRYDNNLRFVDDQLSRFLQAVGPDDTVVLMADHGEEFWDHQGFEHGHTLYDELLKVPLVVRGPGVQAGRVQDRVSLIDVAPTLAAIMGLDGTGMSGRPLQGAADGSDPGFAERPIAFGRPLYGLRSWGVVDGAWKYTAEDGNEHLYQLDPDPAEQRDLARKQRDPIPRLQQALAVGVERPAAMALRLEPSRSSSTEDLEVTVTVPGGVAEAWPGEDPLNYATIEVERLSADQVRLTWKGKTRGVREAYVLPTQALEAVLPQVQVEARHGREQRVAERQWTDPLPAYTGRSKALFRARVGSRSVSVDRAFVPVPAAQDTALTGVDDELQEDLKALGYVDH